MIKASKREVILISVFTISLIGGGYFFVGPKTIEVDQKNIASVSSFSEDVFKKPITVILTGDIMLDRGVEYIVKDDWRFPFLKIADYFKEADIVFGNLEGPISDKGTKVGSIYSFRANPKAIEGLTYANFNVLSLANNHSFDYGPLALKDTFLRLNKAGIDFCGGGLNETEAFSPVIKNINGTKIGFLAYTNPNHDQRRVW